MPSAMFHKDKDSVLDYSVDWVSLLDGGDSIVSSTWSVSSSELSVDSSSVTGTIATVWVSGGVVNTLYSIINHVITAFGREEDASVMMHVMDFPNELTDLMGELRLHLGDMIPSTYRYTDEWLSVALESAVMALQRWWGDKYIFETVGGPIIRNPDNIDFVADSPPIIQDRDRRPIILMASILVKSGQLESNSWSVGSWKDAEIAVSTIEGSKAKQFGLGMDWEELKSYLLPPTKKLAMGLRIPHPSTEE